MTARRILAAASAALFTLVRVNAAPLDDAESLMQARKYSEAAAKLDDAALKSATDPAYARYLRALALNRAKQHEAAIKDCDAVPAKSAWHQKAQFLKAQCFIELHRHQEAEAIYSAEAARLFSAERKEKLADALADYAAELIKEPLPGEAPTIENRVRALELYRKALEIETGATMREDFLFKQAVVLRDLERLPELDTACLAYLGEFDPDWTGAPGSHEHSRGQRNAKAVKGAHRIEIRVMLAANALHQRNRIAARQHAQDLLALWQTQPPKPEDKPDLGDVEWLVCRSYAPLHGHATGSESTLPNVPQSAMNQQSAQGGNTTTFWCDSNPNAAAGTDMGDPVNHAEKLRAFLKNHPKHPRSAEASRALAMAITRSGKAEDSIKAYEDFLKADWPAPAPDPSRTDKRAPAERLADWKQEALFTIGGLRFSLKQYDKAVTQWRDYTTQYPNGPLWQQAQSRIVDAEFQLCLEPVAANDEASARKRFDDFLAKHPLDARAPQLLFLTGQFAFAKAQDLENKKLPAAQIHAQQEAAIAEWAKLVSKYPASEEASLALYRTAVLLSGPLERYEEGLSAFKRLTWGGWKQLAQERAVMLPQKSLALSTEHVFRSNERPSVHVSVRNIEKLRVSVYKLSLEDFFRSRHRIDGSDGIESLDIDLIQPDKTIDVPVKNYARLKTVEQDIEVPFDGAQPGVKIVRVEGDDWQASTIVIRSDIDFIVESAWKEGLVFVQNRVSNETVRDAEVLISNGKEIIGEGRTGADGVLRLKGEMVHEAADLCVFVRTPQGEAMRRLNLRGMTQEIIAGMPSDGKVVMISKRGYIYTDRPAYRPGETVHFRGIIRDVKDGAYVVPEGREFIVRVLGDKARVIYESREKLGAFGTFTLSTPLPAGAPEGEYSIVAASADGAERYRGTFMVNRFQLDDLQLGIDLKPNVVFRGDVITGTVRTSNYWGSAVANEAVQVHMPDGRVLEGRTKADGTFAFTQETSGFQPGEYLRFQATLPSLQLSANAVVNLETSGVRLSVARAPDTVIAGEASSARVKTVSPQGKPLAQTVKLTILRYENAQTNAVLAGLPGLAFIANAKEPEKISEVGFKTDARTGAGETPFTLAAGGTYQLIFQTVDGRGNPATTSTTVFSSANEDPVKLRLFADDTEINEGAMLKARAHSRIAAPLALVTMVGEDIIEHRVVPLKEGHNPLDFAINATHWPRCDVTVAFLDGRELHRVRKSFVVKRRLKLTITPPSDKLEPGTEAEIKLTATDQQGNPVRAELSLALVKRALFEKYNEPEDEIAEFFANGARRGSSYRFNSTASFSHEAQSRQMQGSDDGTGSKTVAAVNHVEQIRSLEQREEQVYQQSRGQGTLVLNGGSMYSGSVTNFSAGAPNSFNGAVTISSGTLITLDAGTLSYSGTAAAGGLPVQGQIMDASRVTVAGKSFGSNIIRPDEIDGLLVAQNNTSGLALSGVFTNPQFGGGGRGAFWNEDEAAKINLSTAAERIGSGFVAQAEWRCPVVTDATGKATVKLPMPAQQGAWRLTAKGCTVKTLVGDAQKEVVTRRNFFVELREPAALREGDVWRPEMRVHLLDGAEADVAVGSTIRFAKGESQEGRTVHVVPGQTTTVFLDAVRITPGLRVLAWSAGARMGTNKAEAATLLAVVPRGVVQTVQTGALVDASTKFSWKLPADTMLLDQRRMVTLHPRPADWLFDMALGREAHIPGVDLPPQTDASSLLATVSALRVARAMKAPNPEIALLEARVRDLIASLQLTQTDGGWPWQDVDWQHDTVVTSLGLWGLREAASLGFTVSSQTIKDGVKYLKTALAIIPPNEPEKAAVILHALALENDADFSVANRLYRDRATLNEPSLAFLAGAFIRMRREGEAREILDVLMKKAVSGEPAHWKGSALVARLSSDGDVTAMALWSLAKAMPQSPMTRGAMLHLLRAGGAQLGAQSPLQGLWAAALAEFFLSPGNAAESGEFTGELLVNGKPWRTIKSDSAWPVLEVPEPLLADGGNEITLKLTSGKVRPFLHATLAMTTETRPAETTALPKIVKRSYLHDTLRHRDLPLKAASTSPVSVAEHGQMLRVEIDVKNPDPVFNSYVVVEEPLPAGFMLVEKSVRSNNVGMDHDAAMLRLWFKPGRVDKITYDLVALQPGEWSASPTVIRDACRAGHLRFGTEARLTVLAPGLPGTDPYEMNRAERFELAKKLFDENAFPGARVHLDALQGDAEARKLYERDIARMLFWIHTAQPQMDARRVVELFETLSERHADLVIPFDKILRVASAYRQIGEFERSWFVDRATIESSFVRDARVSAALRDAGDFMGGAAQLLALWSEHPDVHDVLLAYFSQAQDFQDRAPSAATLPVRAGAAKPTKARLLERSRDLLNRYLTLYADDEAADQAAFNLTNVYFDLKDYAHVASQAESAGASYPKSDFLRSFQYMAALGHFWQYHFPQAIAAAVPVAAGASEDAMNARYITAQIHHAQGHAEEAITWYRKVRDEFPDAAESIAYLEEKRVMLPAATSFKPGQSVKLELSSRNVKEAALKVYKVDLLKLHDRSTSVSDVTKVNLAGITPEAEMKVALGDGKDFAWKKRSVDLPVKNEGAYLVICRGDDLFTSALVLVTPLELELREDGENGSLRVHVKDAAKGTYVADAEIEVLDTAQGRPSRGRTDPRGAFQAYGVSGYATVVVKEGDARYAYHRSLAPLRAETVHSNAFAPPADPFAAPANPSMPRRENNGVLPPPEAKPGKAMSKEDYLFNVKQQLKGNQTLNSSAWEEKVSKGGKGVEAKKALKK